MSVKQTIAKLTALVRRPHRPRCSVCRRTFDTTQGLNTHTTLQHPELEEEEEEVDWRTAQLLGVPLPQDAAAAVESEPPGSPALSADDDMADYTFQPPSPDRASMQPSIEEVPDEYFLERPEKRVGNMGEGAVPFRAWQREQHEKGVNPFAPFLDEGEWELAEWIIDAGVGQTDTDKLLKLRKIQQNCGLSFLGKRDFLKKIDSLPQGVPWNVKKVRVIGDVKDENGDNMAEDLELWYRNPVDVVKDLLSNALFEDLLVYEPVRAFLEESKETRAIDEMWTADWWWELQKRLPAGAMLAPIILASDKTQLSTFRGDKQAYPVYLTIGNIPKAVRRQPSSHSTVLIGYIPVSKLGIFGTAPARSAAQARLFHHCMSVMVEPLKKAGTDGVAALCADGFIRHTFMVVAAYIADYPERCLVACCRQNQCPSCICPPQQRGEARSWPTRAVDKVLNALRLGPSSPDYAGLGLTDVVEPFWADLPHCDIFRSFPPDLLHQLHKGVFGDHLLEWCVKVIGKDEVDRRLATLPSHPAFRHFGKGISMISQWNGAEYRAVEKVILGVVAGHADRRLGQVVRALLDFIFCARMPTHTDDTLRFMADAYDRFHRYKQIFLDLNIREQFNIPKLHSLAHYIEMIRLFGAADGYNTEAPERLHIDVCKQAYRASNRRDYIAQMTTWLRRREAMHRFSSYMLWTLGHPIDGPMADPLDSEAPDSASESGSDISAVGLPQHQVLHALPKHPSFRAQSAPLIIADHHAPQFAVAVQEFIKTHVSPTHFLLAPDDTFDVFKRVSVRRTEAGNDVVRATPAGRPNGSARHKPRPAFFDTALVPLKPSTIPHPTRLLDMQVVRVRVIFNLPPRFNFPDPLIYVEFFNPFQSQRAADVGLLRTSHSVRGGQYRAGVLRLDSIIRSCFLFPAFGPVLDRTWTSHNVFDKAKTFYLNEF
ncbi:hypothetical protein EXIGLDRAFT_646321, partial [Exidia glandulosa HHB12029]